MDLGLPSMPTPNLDISFGSNEKIKLFSYESAEIDLWNNQNGRHPIYDGPTWGGWCGRGYPKTGVVNGVVDGMDRCCMEHDKCYDGGGDIKGCDQSLKNCVNEAPSPNLEHKIYKKMINLYF